MRLILISIIFSLSLVGCYQSMQDSYTGSASTHKALVANLRASGMQVIEQGNRVRIILPRIDFFRPQKNEVLAGKGQALLNLAVLVSTYRHSPVRVIGYTDNISSPADQYYRSLDEAEIVAAFLWRGGVPLSNTTIQAMGGAGAGTVANNATPPGRNANDRVEVWIN